VEDQPGKAVKPEAGSVKRDRRDGIGCLESFLISAALLLFTALVTACGSPRRSEPIAGPLHLTEEAAAGERVFMRHCHQCHPGGEAGLGPALNDKPLPDFMIRFQVRQGFGAMPAFSKTDLADEDLDALLHYLTALKAHG
jgi:mono/diheme cytochrome c family protein